MTNRDLIAVVGLGYVGLANALMLTRKNKVIAHDINVNKINLLNNGISPIEDKDIEAALSKPNDFIEFTEDFERAIQNSKFVLISTPTNYDDATHSFDTSSIKRIIKNTLKINKSAIFIIKSTVPIGFTKRMKRDVNYEKIVFSPEFLREGQALYDNLYPSRIIIGDSQYYGKEVGQLFKRSILKKDSPVLFTNSDEAEAIKLFSNTYLAMRIAYFNELDTYAEIHNFDSKSIIQGICLDPRIGNQYNNPSFGYGGYCLPKDSKQVCADFLDVPHSIISSIVASNEVRKKFISNQILKKTNATLGVYKLSMKLNSDNFREAAIWGVLENLKDTGVEIILYEPSIELENYHGYVVENDFKCFEKNSDLIVANRIDSTLEPYINKVYSRDVFNRD